MVKIVDYKTREKENGDVFFVLVVQGGVEAVVSTVTGRTYLTANRATVPCTFDELTCKSLLGSDLEGEIIKVEVEPYDFVIEDTGEIVKRNHRYTFMNKMEAVLHKNVVGQNEVVY